jgi:hypothetical protein
MEDGMEMERGKAKLGVVSKPTGLRRMVFSRVSICFPFSLL